MTWRKKKGQVTARAKYVPGVMNQTEAWYAKEILDPLLLSGEVSKYNYEALTFKLAKKTTYTPDFYVLYADGHIEIHEIKGFWRDDARVKIKIAAALFPEFTWKSISISKKRIGKIEEF